MCWLTGFALLRSMNAAVGLEESADCRLCHQAPEKADHILRDCPALLQHRWECFGAYQLAVDAEWEVSALCRFLRDERVSNLEDSEVDGSDPPAEYTSEDDELR